MKEHQFDVEDLPDFEYRGHMGEAYPRPKVTPENLEYIIEKHNAFVAFVAAKLER